MPDELEARVRECERSMDRMDGRVGRLEDDMHAFRPIPLENAEYRAETRGGIKGLAEDMHEAFERLRRFEERFEQHVREQTKIREDREAREATREKADAKEKQDRAAQERRDRWQRWATVLALSCTFISMTVGWAVLAF